MPKIHPVMPKAKFLDTQHTINASNRNYDLENTK